jgi:hypothetical protein
MAVRDAMIGGKRSHDDGTRDDLAADDAWTFDDFPESDQRDLGRVDDTKHGFHTLVTQTGDRDGRV